MRDADRVVTSAPGQTLRTPVVGPNDKLIIEMNKDGSQTGYVWYDTGNDSGLNSDIGLNSDL